jgi:hypothetical protein
MNFATLHNPIRENFIMRLCIHKFLSNLKKISVNFTFFLYAYAEVTVNLYNEVNTINQKVK